MTLHRAEVYQNDQPRAYHAEPVTPGGKEVETASIRAHLIPLGADEAT